MASAAVGALGGYVGGKAQARGTVDGVRLQLSGQRLDALWEREVEACIRFVDAYEQALFRVGQVIGVARLSPSQADSLSVYGVGSRDEALRNLRTQQDECLLRLAALRILLPRDLTDRGSVVARTLSQTAHALHHWCAARSIDAPDQETLWQALDAEVATYRQELRDFTSLTQTWFSRPHPSTS